MASEVQNQQVEVPEEQWFDVTGVIHSWDKAKPGDMVQGEYVGSDERPALNGSGTQTLYTLRTANGIVSFFGTTVLNSIMSARVRTGEIVRVTYVGDKPNTDPKRSPIKLFKVQTRKANTVEEVPF